MENFEIYFEDIKDDNNLLKIYKLIEEMENDVLSSNDIKNEFKKISANSREINQLIFDVIFFKLDEQGQVEIDIQTYDEFDEYDNNRKKEIIVKYISNHDAKKAIYSMHDFGNLPGHIHEKTNSKNIQKNPIIHDFIVYFRSISIVFFWLFNHKGNLKFEDKIYYKNEINSPKINVNIKKQINSTSLMDIKIEEVRIIDLIFDKNINFKIPLYQRGYKWSKENINELFYDLEKRMEDEKNHFFGNVSFIKENFEKDKRKTNIKIIDGQQRITTILLILRAIYQKYLNKSDYKIDEKLKEFIENKKLSITRVDSKKAMEILNIIWKDGTINSLNEEQLKNEIAIVYKEILNKLYLYDLEKIDQLFFALKNLIIGINWIKNFNEFELFDSLNSKGKELSLFDKFKNYIFSIIDNEIEEIKEKEIGAEFDNLLTIKFNILKKAELKNKVEKILIEKFILIYGRKKINSSRVFNQFIKVFNNKYLNEKKSINFNEYKKIIFEFSKLLTSIILTQIDYLDYWKESEFKNCYDDFRFLSKSWNYNLVLIPYLISEKNIKYDEFDCVPREILDENELKNIIKLVEKWKVRRDVSYDENDSWSDVNFNSLFFELMDEYNENENYLKFLDLKIKSKTNNISIPKIEKFGNDLINKSISKKSSILIIMLRISQKIDEYNDINFKSNIGSFSIIEKDPNKRSLEWKEYIDRLNIHDFEIYDKIGNYYIDNQNKKQKINNLDDLFIKIKTDNFTTNLNNKFDNNKFISINDMKKLNSYSYTFENFVKKRSEIIAKYAIEIFN